jgi:hypothetical protein
MRAVMTIAATYVPRRGPGPVRAMPARLRRPMPVRLRRLLPAVAAALLVTLPATIAASDFVSSAHAQALDLYYQGRLEEARLAYLNVLETAPGNHRVLLELSRTESELGVRTWPTVTWRWRSRSAARRCARGRARGSRWRAR